MASNLRLFGTAALASTLSACAYIQERLEPVAVILPEGARNLIREKDTTDSRAFFGGFDTETIFGAPPGIPPSVEQSLQGVSLRLARAAGRDVAVQVADCDDFNAFSTPDDTIFVCRGALLAAGAEDAIAFLVAHELGHIELGHTSALRRIERTQQQQQLVGATASGVTGFVIFAGTAYFLFEGVDPIATDIEEWIGVDTPEEDEDNDIDSGLQALAILGGAYIGTQSGGGFFDATERVREFMQRFTQSTYVERAPSDEFSADAYAVRLITAAGYSPFGADFVLSAERADGPDLSSLTGTGARAAFGDLGTDASAPTTWRHILLNYKHPATAERRARVQRMLSNADETSIDRAVELDLCPANNPELDRQVCMNWMDAASALPLASAQFFAITRSVSQGQGEEARELCALLAASLQETKAALGLDRGVARIALNAALVCHGQDWSDLALAPYASIGMGGYDYLRELASFYAVRGSPAIAYDLAGRLGSRASGNAATFADYVQWSLALGFHELASDAMVSCAAGVQAYLVADQGRFCTDLYARAQTSAPTHSTVMFGSGLSVRQKLAALWQMSLFQQALSYAETQEQQLVLIQHALSSSSPPPANAGNDDTRRWCLPASTINPRIAILSFEQDLIYWRDASVNCLAPASLHGPPARIVTQPDTATEMDEQGRWVVRLPANSARRPSWQNTVGVDTSLPTPNEEDRPTQPLGLDPK